VGIISGHHQQIRPATDELADVLKSSVPPNRSFETADARDALQSPFHVPNDSWQAELVQSAIALDRVDEPKRRNIEAPIPITRTGTIIGGFSHWHQAISDGRPTVVCLEYSLTNEEALEFILTQFRPRQNWNDFTRIRIALELETNLQEKALENQIAGGKYKGLANLPKPEQIDVRREIARIAGVGSRNVSNVKTILRRAHPALIDGLSNGSLRIHRAMKWCTLSQAQQGDQFVKYAVECRKKRAIRRSLASLMKEKVGSDTLSALRRLRNREVGEPGSLLVRTTRLQRTVILLGRDFFGSNWEKELCGNQIPTSVKNDPPQDDPILGPGRRTPRSQAGLS
jgi:hypothetical protein